MFLRAPKMFGLAVLAVVSGGACQDPEMYYRNVQVTVGDAGVERGAPTTGAAGAPVVPTTGAAGTFGSGLAGTSGAAGRGTGVAGVSGAAGGGTSGAAGAAGAAGASGAAGAPASGAAGAGGGTCPGCKVTVLYTCLSDASDQASFVVEAQNKGTVAFLLGELTLRYWFTQDAGKEPELNCDTARLGCDKVPSSTSQPPVKFTPVTPPRAKANTYFDVKFPAGAVDVNGTTGTIQLRLHNKDYTPLNQSDDYSVDCGQKNVAHDSGKITAYIKGVLVGGTEPGP